MTDLNPLGKLWSERAKNFGKRCVLDLSFPAEQYDSVTAYQIRQIFPRLLRELNGRERNILDYGCGPGRFTPLLHHLNPQARTIGFDPCAELIDIARKSSPGPEYATGDPRAFLDLAAGQFDVIFIALVLGGLPQEILPELANRLTIALRFGGLIFFAEHTHDFNSGNDFWHFYRKTFYPKLFPAFPIHNIGCYFSLGNEITLFSGRKF